jgi:chemotaxis protein MotA
VHVFLILGLTVVFGSIFVGYTMHGGNLMVLVQVSEFIIIGGCAIGALLASSSPAVMVQMLKEVVGLLKPSPYSKNAYKELLGALYEVFFAARREGLVGIESHVEEPHDSDIFKRYPGFLKQHHAVEFFTDTLKVLLTGTIEEHHLSEILELDLEKHAKSAHDIPAKLATVGDALPGFGIVAAVLGVIITMGHIGGPPEEIGQKVGAALVGTFLGILGAYGFVHPIAQSLEGRHMSEEAYMDCIRVAILSFARGDPPLTSVEFARRAIGGPMRPSFREVEALTATATEAATQRAA